MSDYNNLARTICSSQTLPHLELFPVPELFLASCMAEVVVMFAKFPVHVGHHTLYTYIDERIRKGEKELRRDISIIARNEQ